MVLNVNNVAPFFGVPGEWLGEFCSNRGRHGLWARHYLVASVSWVTLVDMVVGFGS